MIEYLNKPDEEIKAIVESQTKEETFNFIIKLLDNGNEMTIEEIDFIYKICEIKSITIDEIEKYFESYDSLKN